MIEGKKYDKLVDEALGKIAASKAAMATARADAARARAAADEVDQRAADVQRQITGFESGSLELSDAEYLRLLDESRLLAVRAKRARSEAAAADQRVASLGSEVTFGASGVVHQVLAAFDADVVVARKELLERLRY